MTCIHRLSPFHQFLDLNAWLDLSNVLIDCLLIGNTDTALLQAWIGVAIQERQGLSPFVGLVLGQNWLFRVFVFLLAREIVEMLQIRGLDRLCMVLQVLLGHLDRSGGDHFFLHLSQVQQGLQGLGERCNDGLLVEILVQDTPAGSGIDALGTARWHRSGSSDRRSRSLGSTTTGRTSNGGGLVGFGTGVTVGFELEKGLVAALVISWSVGFEGTPNFYNLVLELVVSVLARWNGVVRGNTAVDQVAVSAQSGNE